MFSLCNVYRYLTLSTIFFYAPCNKIYLNYYRCSTRKSMKSKSLNVFLILKTYRPKFSAQFIIFFEGTFVIYIWVVKRLTSKPRDPEFESSFPMMTEILNRRLPRSPPNSHIVNNCHTSILGSKDGWSLWWSLWWPHATIVNSRT